MVVFTSEASIYSELQFVNDAYSSIRSQWESLFLCSAEYIPVDCSADPVGRGAGTDQAAALNLSIGELMEARADNTTAQQNIVLISDGVPYCTGTCDFGGCFGAILTEALAYADYASEDENITIHTVSYSDPSGTSEDASGCSDYSDAISEQDAFMESLVRGSGEFYSASSSDELSAIFTSIGRSMPIALVQ